MGRAPSSDAAAEGGRSKPLETRLLVLLIVVVIAIYSWTAFGPESGRAESTTPSWITASLPDDDTVPASAYYLARDFVVPRELLYYDLVQDAHEPQALLDVASDTEVVVYVNGLWLGGIAREMATGVGQPSSFELGERQPPERTWSVRRLLHPGLNRLMIEVRGPRGGVVMAALRARGAAPEEEWQRVVQTDAQWLQIGERFPGLHEGSRSLDELGDGSRLAARDLGRPPVGRFAFPRSLGGNVEGPGDDAEVDLARSPDLLTGSTPIAIEPITAGSPDASGGSPHSRRRLRSKLSLSGSADDVFLELVFESPPGRHVTLVLHDGEDLRRARGVELRLPPGERRWRSAEPLSFDEVTVRGAVPQRARVFAVSGV